jgi:hypothetical protein
MRAAVKVLGALGLGLAPVAWAADAPAIDFTGHWVLDDSASQSMDPIFSLQGLSWVARKAAATLDNEAVIAQQGDRLVVTFDNITGEARQELFFDGQPHPTVNPAGMATTFTSSWADGGKALVAVGAVEADDGTTGTLTEYRTLSADGAVMTVALEVAVPDGRKATSSRVYRRQ